jgi:hypothetical protein
MAAVERSFYSASDEDDDADDEDDSIDEMMSLRRDRMK